MSQVESDAARETLVVLRAKDRDEEAFHELVRRYERRILYYSHRILGSDFDFADVLQEIWMKVFLRITTLDAPEAFRVWLYKIAHDVAIDQLRKNRRYQVGHIGDTPTVEAEISGGWNERELLENAEVVHATLDRLSLLHREVLTLRFLEGLDLSEIAEVLSCSIGTVKSRIYYAKSAMRKLLEASYDE
ncbi:MAG: sigma-70 family RNA polymerase sigma factor [Planctomycetales bacterium]|nr:sigma-70 family RNA polymerase sigma factor [Planctomycetales bacterium]